MQRVTNYRISTIDRHIHTQDHQDAIREEGLWLGFSETRYRFRGGRVVQWCWVIFQCRGVLLIWIRVGQGLTVLAVGAGGGCLDIFSLVYHFSILSPSLWETARYRLKYCLKGPLSPKQPTNQDTVLFILCKLFTLTITSISFLKSRLIRTAINTADTNVILKQSVIIVILLSKFGFI